MNNELLSVFSYKTNNAFEAQSKKHEKKKTPNFFISKDTAFESLFIADQKQSNNKSFHPLKNNLKNKITSQKKSIKNPLMQKLDFKKKEKEELILHQDDKFLG